MVNEIKEKIVVIWMWYVWFPTACAIAKNPSYKVYWLDVLRDKVERINKKIAPIDDLLNFEDLSNLDLKGTTDEAILDNAKFILICVPTPVDEENNPDLTIIRSVSLTIARHLSEWQYIVLESTVNPWVCYDVIIPLLEESGLKCWVDFYLWHCPERINPWDTKWNIYNIPRNVWAVTEQSTSVIANFYRSFIKAEINEMCDIAHTEATKIVENTFRDINIAYVNELAKSFDILWLDVIEVIRGSSNKPFAFMAHYPWCGVGWHCIAVDPYYLIKKAEEAWFNHKFLKTAREINNSMPEYLVDKLMSILKEMDSPLKSLNIWLLGLSYKKDIADIRESPSLEILSLLEKLGFNIDIFDPYNLEKSTCNSLEELLLRSKHIIIATNHTLFVEWLNIDTLTRYWIRLVLDWRNCLEKKSFETTNIIYSGIGR